MNDSSPWDEMTGQKDDLDSEVQGETLEASVLRMVSEVSAELRKVHSGKYDEKKAIRTAALALKAQMDLSEFLSDVEAKAKGSKVALKEVEAEVYFECRESSEKKLSEAALTQMVAKDKKTAASEAALVDSERSSKKWALIFANLKEAHIFFRNLGKNDWSI